MRLRTRLALGFTAILVAVAAPASAQTDPYAADPLGLVPFIDTAQQVYSSGTDTWEVWICEVANGDTPVDLTETVSLLNTDMTPYWEWLSNGAYTTEFTAGGVVSSADVVQDPDAELENPFAPGCENAVASASDSGPNGVVIVVDVAVDDGYGTFGTVCPEDPFTGCTTTYPSNARRAVVSATAVTIVEPFTEPQLITVAHEMGHAQHWAHSYTGLTFDPDTGAVDRYDNPMDMLSAEDQTGDPIGTLAYHRYEAGWITPGQVVIHSEGVADYRLATVGGTGTQMVVIPGASPGRFFTLETRRRASYDSDLPMSGVAVHSIDQRREIACDLPDGLPTSWPCFATLTRISPFPAVEGGGTQHVIGLDEELSVGLFDVSIIAADQTSFTIRVSRRDSGRFIDDDGNLHEPAIETIASLGITIGCNPPDNDRYCPDSPVTRAEMAAFIVRAVDGGDPTGAYSGRFPDVPEEAWYALHVERLAVLGVTLGYDDGTYRPNSIVTRAEMAAFMTRGFVDPVDVVDATGVFADVSSGAWYADFAETLFDQGITKGCLTTPLSFCPNDAVLRDQMASFVARALP